MILLNFDMRIKLLGATRPDDSLGSLVLVSFVSVNNVQSLLFRLLSILQIYTKASQKGECSSQAPPMQES